MVSKGFLFVGITLLLTVIGQLMIKWRVDEAGEFPESGKARFLFDLLLDPWVILAFGLAVVAALAYLAALANLELSRAYPVMALSFGLVLIGSAIFFSEALTATKVVGVLVITFGVIIATR